MRVGVTSEVAVWDSSRRVPCNCLNRSGGVSAELHALASVLAKQRVQSGVRIRPVLFLLQKLKSYLSPLTRCLNGLAQEHLLFKVVRARVAPSQFA